jgi:hypothetical protein
LKRARKQTESVTEARAFIFSKGRLWLQLSEGPRWKGLWLLPTVEESGRSPDHEVVYPITRYRVTMKVFAAHGPTTGLQAFLPGHLPPMPSPHRRAAEAMLKRGNL